MVYVDNDPYEYPSIDLEHVVERDTIKNDLMIPTGWHVIPNFLWRHVCIPRQWDELVHGCEAYKVKSITGTVYNPIPITSNISLSRINLFSAFNNCTYGMTYTDDLYETDWYPWLTLRPEYQLHLGQREGLVWRGTQQSDSNTYYCNRYYWPKYEWRRPNMRNIFDNTWSQGKDGQAGVHDTQIGLGDTSIKNGKLVTPNGVFWDPLNRPDKIGEIRAGKNSIGFHYSVHPSDEDKWFNLDVMAAFSAWGPSGPYCGQGRPGTLKETTAMDPIIASTYGLARRNTEDRRSQGSAHGTGAIPMADYTIPNLAWQPIMPTMWFWKELQQTVAEWLPGPEDQSTGNTIPYWWKINKGWPGTEKEACLYPPTQWFIKGIPLYDASNEHIRTTTQMSFKIKLVLEGKKRRSAYYCPTYGPISGQQLYYQTNRNMIFQPACIRYRTGGMRRGWQNIGAAYTWKNNTSDANITANERNLKAHARMAPYKYQMDVTQTTFEDQCRYNQNHAITGVGDISGANRTVKEAMPTLRVRWTRATDSTEILMDDE